MADSFGETFPSVIRLLLGIIFGWAKRVDRRAVALCQSRPCRTKWNVAYGLSWKVGLEPPGGRYSGHTHPQRVTVRRVPLGVVNRGLLSFVDLPAHQFVCYS